MFDHHELESSESEEKYKSTVRTLFCEEKLLENTVDEILNNLDKDNTVRIYTHIGPDLDALVSAYIVTQRLLLNKDEYESWINSEEVIRLIDYVDAIDQGKNKVVDSATLYCCFTYMYDDSVKKYWGITSEEAISERVREQAFVWLDQVIQTLKQSDRFNLFYSELPVLPDDEVFGLIKQALVREGNLAYQRDKRENRLKIKNIPIWTKVIYRNVVCGYGNNVVEVDDYVVTGYEMDKDSLGNLVQKTSIYFATSSTTDRKTDKDKITYTSFFDGKLITPSMIKMLVKGNNSRYYL